MSTFALKQLRFTFVLANNAVFAGTNSNTLVVSGLRASAFIRAAGLPAFPESDITIYGLKQQDMISLTALAFLLPGGTSPPTERNTIIVEANSSDGWTTVFSGQIITAGPDYTGAPAAALKISARVLYFDSLNPATPTSYTGATDVATIVGALASKMGYAFENNGVSQSLSNPYLSGTLPDQLRAVQQAANIDVYIEGNTIAICPKGVPRDLPTWTLSPKSGLVGYPQLDYNRGFVSARAVFNPAFRFGGKLTIEGSDVPLANGNWAVGTLAHQLESLQPNGAWFSELLLYPPGSLPPIS